MLKINILCSGAPRIMTATDQKTAMTEVIKSNDVIRIDSRVQRHVKDGETRPQGTAGSKFPDFFPVKSPTCRRKMAARKMEELNGKRVTT